jgi:esterase/lipase
MIWDFQDAIARRLLLWSALNMLGGLIMLASGSPWWRGFGVQALVWGAIDGAIAIGGRIAGERRRRTRGSELNLPEREAYNLRRLLWINTGLDVLYVAGGVTLAATLGRTDSFALGNGWGVIVQGSFLFGFDLLHAVTVPRKEPALPVLPAFDAPEHQAFRLEGTRGSALLVHGFGGTPSELRSLAEALHRDGWSVDVLLLPGFGAGIGTLMGRRYEEWLEAVTARAAEIKRLGPLPLILVGYSVGAALSIAAERELRPAGMVLLAPFLWAEKPWVRLAEFFVRPFLPIGFRPMRKADLSSPSFRAGIDKFVPGLDLDDPDVQAAVRDFRVPLGLIDQLRRLSRHMLTAATSISTPVLIVQGTRDSVARPASARKLLAKLPESTRYVEVNSEHDLTLPTNPCYHEVEQLVTSFANTLRGDGR